MQLPQSTSSVHKVNFDICELGIEGVDKQSKAPIRKRTSVLTSSEEVAAALAKRQCKGDHKRVRLTARCTMTTASDYQMYPEKCCRTLCEAFSAQEHMDAMGWR